MWAVNEKEAFKAWYDEETKDDTKHHSTKAETSLKTWVRIGEDLIEHGLTEKTWVYLPNKERENVLDILKDVVHEMENMKEE